MEKGFFSKINSSLHFPCKTSLFRVFKMGSGTVPRTRPTKKIWLSRSARTAPPQKTPICPLADPTPPPKKNKTKQKLRLWKFVVKVENCILKTEKRHQSKNTGEILYSESRYCRISTWPNFAAAVTRGKKSSMELSVAADSVFSEGIVFFNRKGGICLSCEDYFTKILEALFFA